MSSLVELENIYKDFVARINSASSDEEIESFRLDSIGKKGKITQILKTIGGLSVEEKKSIGKRANEINQELELLLTNRKKQILEVKLQELEASQSIDHLRPIQLPIQGHLHPITSIQYEIEDIFTSMGFSILDGPEIETDYNNFEALNFTEDHPARDMQDTFYLENNYLLRTHTSAIQARALKHLKPPFRVIAPGRVFRYEEVDASHETTFYQVEGMVVGKDISIANMTYTMEVLLSKIFGGEIKTRLRPGYFPFVEPGFELDFQCRVCLGKGCSVCKQSGWVELLPCGLIHPNVLKFGGLDPDVWTGFAFGLGLDRLVMMRHGINDIRYFHSGNLRFLNQF